MAGIRWIAIVNDEFNERQLSAQEVFVLDDRGSLTRYALVLAFEKAEEHVRIRRESRKAALWAASE